MSKVKIGLGSKASIYTDSKAGVKVTAGHYVEVEKSILTNTKKFKQFDEALRGGQIVKLTDSDIDERELTIQPTSRAEQVGEVRAQKKEEKKKGRENAKPADDEEEDDQDDEKTIVEFPAGFNQMDKDALLVWANDQEDDVISAEFYEELGKMEKAKDIRKAIKEVVK